MNASQSAFMISRVIAIYFSYQALQVVIALAASMGSAHEPIVFLYSAVNVVVNGAIAVFFWFFAEPVSKRLLPHGANPEKSLGGAGDMQMAAVILAGFLFFIKAVPQISQIALIITQKFIIPDMPFRFSPSELWSSSIEAVLYLAAGLFLVLGAKGVSSCISKARGRE